MSKISKLFDKAKNKKHIHASLNQLQENTPTKPTIQEEPIEESYPSFLDEGKEEWEVQGLEPKQINNSAVSSFKILTVNSAQIAAKEVKAKTWASDNTSIKEEDYLKEDNITYKSKSNKQRKSSEEDPDLHQAVMTANPKLNNNAPSISSTIKIGTQPHLRHSFNNGPASNQAYSKKSSAEMENLKLKEMIDTLNKELTELKSYANSLDIEKPFDILEHIKLSTYKKKSDIIPNQEYIREKYAARRKLLLT